MTKNIGSMQSHSAEKAMEEGKISMRDMDEDIEASAAPLNHLAKNDKRLAINRTISFHEGLDRRNRPGRSKSVTTIDTSSSANETEDEDEDDDLDLDDDDDDAMSTFSTEASFISEDEQDEDQRKPGRLSKLTPKVIKRRQERRRKQKQRIAYENSIGKDAKVYRRMPVLTGVIAPFSIMLEIPGFTSRWYVSRAGGTVLYRANPIILDVGLALSLFCAIVANLAILGRFAERIAPRRSTIIAGTCLITHDIINAVALVTFGVVHAVNDGFTYSEAYWMTTAATAASLICTTSLIIDYCITVNFRNAGSGLTPKQAQLVMVIMAFLAYISISAMIFALILPLPFLDAMYFTVETLATIGLGDISPTNTGSRVALFFIAPGGIVLLAVVVAIARQTIIEEFEAAYKKRRAIFKQKAAEKREEKRKNRHLRVKIKKGGGGRGGGGRGGGMTSIPTNLALELQQQQAALSSLPTQLPMAPQLPTPTAKTADGGRWFGGSWTGGFSRRGANVPKPQYLSTSDGENGYSEDNKSISDSTFESGHSLHRTDTGATNATQLRELEMMLINQRQGIEQSFKQFRLDLAKQERNEFWTKLGVAFAMFACFWLLGGAVFSVIEGWTYFQGFYFVFVIFSTIGYGDLSPKSSAGRAFFIVWALFGVGTLTILFSVVSDAWANRVQQRKLAGEEVVEKPSLWARFSKKVKGKKGREKQARKERAKKEEAEAQEDEKSGSASPSGSTEKDPQDVAILNSSDGKSGGILKDSAGKEALGGSKNGSVEEITPSPINEEDEEETEPIDIRQLHLDFTAKAMEFNMSALDSMQNNRSGLMEAFKHVPEMRETLEKIQFQSSSNGKKQVLAVEDRKLLVDRIKATGDVEALHTTNRWLLLQDFEQMLHSLVEQSSKFETEMDKKELLLQDARDEIRHLRRRVQNNKIEEDFEGEQNVEKS